MKLGRIIGDGSKINFWEEKWITASFSNLFFHESLHLHLKKTRRFVILGNGPRIVGLEKLNFKEMSLVRNVSSGTASNLFFMIK
ncbi:Uncharacterized protein TCM_025999 [Theobroma cacao]|uniref:Uncharacterized protein n=1 Tax=Theobroma cacao TaxID=3641 RepID=A0A061F0Z7_THECC|nr:Uncharacterized protein TCM_025999 [Theobroma cacao]